MSSGAISEKERIIRGIKDRIDSEYRKYGNVKEIDWSRIAAQKIYATYNCSIQRR
jgi:hypothetical protein